jgi:hypothetical protein
MISVLVSAAFAVGALWSTVRPGVWQRELPMAREGSCLRSWRTDPWQRPQERYVAVG